MENKVTKEVIDDLKQKYGDKVLRKALLYKDDEGTETLEVIVRVPDRKVLGEFEKWVDKNPDKAKDILVSNCVLTSKDEVKADDGLFFAAVDAIAGLFPKRKAIVSNL